MSSLHSVLSPAAAAAVESDQQHWLEHLKQLCAGAPDENEALASCLQAQYSRRSLELRPQLLSNGHRLYSRHVVILLPNPDARQSQPPVGKGEFSFPALDGEDAESRKFNQLSEEFIREMNVSSSTAVPSDLRQATEAQGEVLITWSVTATNSQLLTIGFHSLHYQYGAAHPLSKDRFLSWWLFTSHELQPEDVFTAASEWQRGLIQPVTVALERNPDLHGHLWDGKQYPSGVPEAISRSRSWTLDSRGLTFHFDQYEVAAYVFGMPSARLTWSELQHFLNPGLKPRTLPALSQR